MFEWCIYWMLWVGSETSSWLYKDKAECEVSRVKFLRNQKPGFDIKTECLMNEPVECPKCENDGRLK